MKVNELMVGDWVILDNIAPKRLCLGDIVEISRGMEATPIPLTEDILKANGFARKPLMKRWVIDGELELIEDTMGNMEIEYWFSVSDQYICPIHHVHELQHVLRLCGLNGITDNIKVKL